MIDCRHLIPAVATGLALCVSLLSCSATEALDVEWFARTLSERGLSPADGSGPDDATGWVVFVALVFMASMLSEDLTCIGVGLLVGRGAIGLAGGSVACGIALVAGDLLLYAGGRWLGNRHIGRRLRERAARASPSRYGLGAAAIVASRFVPGTRLPTYVAAGAVRYPAGQFMLLLVSAIAVWTPLVVGLTAAGTLALDGLPMLRDRALLATAVVVAVAFGVERGVLPALRTRGRRLLLARWMRLRRWEFWPIPVVYAPLLPYIGWLAIRSMGSVRSGGLRVPLLANPGIELGGLAGESKSAILTALDPPPELGLPLELLPPEASERRERALAFAAAHGLPVVVKPDVGERGHDVTIARDVETLLHAVDSRQRTTLLQGFAAGTEFGVYYARLPREAHGRVLSIAEKRMPVLEGDGVHSLEQLILRDPRTLPNARRLLATHAARLGEIPSRGERVRVVELGTHSRGCQFLDRSDLWTEALEARFEQLSRRFEGFFLGRYDVRTLDVSAFRDGGPFKVLELNGLTAEPAHMYDPKFGLLRAQRELRAHWRRAFEIGSAQVASGTPLPHWRAIAADLRRYRSAVR